MGCTWWELAAAVSAVCLLFYIWATWHYSYFKSIGVPFLTPTVFIGSTGKFWFGRVSLGELSLEMYRKFKGKRFFGYFDFRQPFVMVRDPEIIKMVTTKDFDHFTDHRPFIREQDDNLFGKSIFSLTGMKWKRMRNILTPAFTSSKMKSMFSLVAECGTQLDTYLEQRYTDEAGKPLVLDMMDLFTRYSNDVIATAAFGVHCDSLKEPDNEFYNTGKEALDFGGINMVRFLAYMAVPDVMKMMNIPLTLDRVNNFFQSLVGETMRTREREGIVRPDLIHLLMQAKKGTLTGDDDATTEQTNGTKGIKADMSDEDVTAQAFIFFLAGFDTSSTLDCFLAQLLAERPDVQRRVQDEIDEVLQREDGRLTYDGVVHHMKYLDMVVSETLRLWPPVLELDRLCVKPFTIPATASTPAIVIKKGQTVNIPVLGLHRDPEYYPDPDRFDPERFSEDNKHSINPFAYLPFGTGPRACIGLRFALMATKIMIVSVLSRFDLEVTAKTSIPMRYEKGTFNTTIQGGFWLAVKPRAKQNSQ